MSYSLPSHPDPDSYEAPSWLVEQVYIPKRQRTMTLVKQSVEVLTRERQRISLASIAAKSKEIDPDLKGAMLHH